MLRRFVSYTMQAIQFGRSLPGYEMGEKAAPAVIVVQEWWGVNDVIKALGVKLNRLGGYRVLIPDLYKGKIGVDAEEAKHLMSSLGWETGIDEVKQAVAYLKETGSPKVGITGFCMGGAISFCAAQYADVACAAPFYGIPPPSACQPTEIKIPVQAHFGKLDSMIGFSDPKTAGILEASMKEAGVPCEFFHYEEAGHAFMNEGEEAEKISNSRLTGTVLLLKRIFPVMGHPIPPAAHREEAWTRLVQFFDTHLKP